MAEHPPNSNTMAALIAELEKRTGQKVISSEYMLTMIMEAYLFGKEDGAELACALLRSA